MYHVTHPRMFCNVFIILEQAGCFRFLICVRFVLFCFVYLCHAENKTVHKEHKHNSRREYELDTPELDTPEAEG